MPDLGARTREGTAGERHRRRGVVRNGWRRKLTQKREKDGERGTGFCTEKKKARRACGCPQRVLVSSEGEPSMKVWPKTGEASRSRRISDGHGGRHRRLPPLQTHTNTCTRRPCTFDLKQTRGLLSLSDDTRSAFVIKHKKAARRFHQHSAGHTRKKRPCSPMQPPLSSFSFPSS